MKDLGVNIWKDRNRGFFLNSQNIGREVLMVFQDFQGFHLIVIVDF